LFGLFHVLSSPVSVLRFVPLLSRENVLDHGLVLLLIAVLEAHLRVPNDAAGVDNERRSAEGVLFPKVRSVPVEDRVGDLQFFGELSSLVRVWVHGDHEHVQTLIAVSLMKLLEMAHLLAGERSVS
jgi:hypothetical protein